MLDSHCHVDLLSDPIKRARELNAALSVCVAVTYLPEHFELARRHLAPFSHVIPSLGMHPLHASRAYSQLARFRALAANARFIGEIGLDGSVEGKQSLPLQTKVFEEVVSSLRAGRFVTVHSRAAWQETSRILDAKNVGPVCFHYFTGGLPAAQSLIAKGHYFSVNRRMIEPTGRHREVVEQLPRNRVLVESDAPFLGQSSILQDLGAVYAHLAEAWKIDTPRAIAQVESNFANCRTA